MEQALLRSIKRSDVKVRRSFMAARMQAKDRSLGPYQDTETKASRAAVAGETGGGKS
jgi:hypothetical protein